MGKNLIKRLMAGASLAVLTACASGPQFRVPEVSRADVQQVQVEQGPPPKIKRTPLEEAQLVKRVADNLRTAAAPICADAKIDCSAFKVFYNSGDVVNAFATQAQVKDPKTGQVKMENQLHGYHGLIQYMTEPQIANVVGHEMAHLIGRHPEDTQTRAQIGGVAAAIGAAILSGGNRELTQAGGQLGATAAVLSYSKSQERQSDVVGGYIVHRAGYNLDEAGKAWVTLTRLQEAAKKGTGLALSGMFSTHPTSAERIVAWKQITEEIRANPTGLPPRTDSPKP